MENEKPVKPVLPTGKPHISHSEMCDWVDCSWRHKLKHVQKIDLDAPSVNLSFGTAVHAVIENFLKTKVIDVSIAEKILDEAFEKFALAEDFQKNDKKKLLGIVQNMMVDFPPFLDETFPGWELVEAEEPLYEDLEAFFEKHKGLSFKGFIDIVIKVPAKKPGTFLYWILDAKTANRPWNLDKIKNDNVRRQLILYKQFWSKKHNVDIKDIRCGFVTLVKTSKPGKYCKLIPISVGEIAIGRSLVVLNNSLASIKRGVALKNRNSCKYCVYKNTEHCT